MNKACATVNVSGPDAISNSYLKGINAYPNPTSGTIEIEFDRLPGSVKVMDMTGRVVMERTALQLKESFNLSELKNGIYVFQVNYGSHDKYLKVIKR